MRNLSELTGIILAGGYSSRMGTAKHLISYHGVPQIKFLGNLLSGFCGRVVISCRPEQVTEMLQYGEIIIDDVERFGDNGPITALLSILTGLETDILIAGCDYPWLNAITIETLLTQITAPDQALVFRNPDDGLPEPLIGIYRKACLDSLLSYQQSGGISLRKWLADYRIRMITPADSMQITSVDTPVKMREAIQSINQKNSWNPPS